MKYQIVMRTKDGWVTAEPTDIYAWASLNGMKVIAIKQQAAPGRIQFREEMIGQPIFDKLIGPMYGGPGVCRYENLSAYDTLSA